MESAFDGVNVICTARVGMKECVKDVTSNFRSVLGQRTRFQACNQVSNPVGASPDSHQKRDPLQEGRSQG